MFKSESITEKIIAEIYPEVKEFVSETELRTKVRISVKISDFALLNLLKRIYFFTNVINSINL